MREVGAFGVVGGVAFFVDVSLFQLLYAHLGAGAVTAKLTASLVSMALAFLGHRFWSFASRARTGLHRESALFFLVNVVTLLLSLAIVAFVRYPLGQESPIVLQATNVVSILIGTAVRYLSYRRWVFPSQARVAARSAGGQVRSGSPEASPGTASLLVRGSHQPSPR